MEMNFCRRCSAPLENVKGHVYKCQNGHIIYANSSPCTSIFLLTPDNKVLLSVRGIDPHKGMLDSFGGFADGAEKLDDCALRELHEETGLTSEDHEPLRYLCTEIDNYPYKGEEIPYSGVYYWTRLTSNKQTVPSDDVAEIRSFDADEVDIKLLHDDATRQGFLRLRDIINQERGKS